MRLNPSTLNITRIIIATTLSGAFISAPQPSAAAQQAAKQVQRPLVLAPETPLDLPTAAITVSPGVSGQGPLLVSFDSVSSTSGITGSTALTYAWSFGDGFTGTLAQVNHIFAQVGNFNVALTVTNSAGQSAAKGTVITVTSMAALPAPYFGVNIGTFVPGTTPGSRLYTTGPFAGSLATCSNGVDIYTPPDDLRYAYRQMSGDGEVVGRLVDINRAPDMGKVGVMVRETLGDSAKYFFIGTDNSYDSDKWAANAGFTYRAQWRTATFTDSQNLDVSNQFPTNILPRWFKISRQVNTFVSWLSLDGVAWTPVATQTIPMPTTVFGGYAITSIDGVSPTPMNCAYFDNLNLIDNPPIPTPPTAVLTATPTSGSAPLIVQLDGTASDSAGTIPGIKGYLWDFGDGMTSTEASAIHVYPNVGTYNVTLTVTNYDDLTASANASINVSAGVPTGTLPSPWVSQDIITILDKPGASNMSTFVTNTVLATCGTGNDISTDTDRFRFEYYPLKGNGEIKARMLSMDVTGGSFGGKAGLMIRETTDKGSKNFSLVQNRKAILNDSSLRYQFRSATNGQTLPDSGFFGYLDGYSQPAWMKVSRNADVFVAYTSTNGLDWTPVATETIPMVQTVLAGFAVTSLDPNTLNCAVFDNISTPGPSNLLVFLPLLSR